MKHIVLFLLIFFQAIISESQETSAIRTMADRKQSSITYSMRHPLHAWTGVSREVSSVIISEGEKSNIKQVAVSARVATFDSKNANRDSHMLEVLEALKYPNITFSGNVVSRLEETLEVRGELTFHGITKPLSFEVTAIYKGGKLEVNGGFTVELSDFDISRPTLMGIPTNEEIRIEFVMVY
jgi:polyisoprenoid-binding protein YceI